MNDNDLRALAAKLLKHYVAAQSPVAEAIVAQIPLDRVPAKQERETGKALRMTCLN